jgi:hypothetical protein
MILSEDCHPMGIWLVEQPGHFGVHRLETGTFPAKTAGADIGMVFETEVFAWLAPCLGGQVSQSRLDNCSQVYLEDVAAHCYSPFS